ncbi:MAG TPA: Fic family protein [Polyangiaceae bacterium]|nr:Fic family protein [Polyangiaceae bacterium]
MRILAHQLRWEHVDPASNSFDPELARDIAERIVRPVASQLKTTRDSTREDPLQTQCELDLDQALIARYGAWVAGWNWAASEPGGGGPVRAWCCARDSILRPGEPTEATIDRVARAVREWRAFLEGLAQMQASIAEEVAALHREDAIERAASRYLPFVLDRTGAEDAWFGTFRVVLTWHFQALGDADERVEAALREVTRGRFESWTAPSAAVAADVCADLGLRVAEVLATPPIAPDALAQWLKLRESTTWDRGLVPDQRAVAVDGHRAFIDARDRARSAARAERMHSALTFVREAAAQPLTWALLKGAQRLVLGADDVDFRQGEAFAKGGRERYGLDADTPAAFERCLAEANDTNESPLVRAARVYLDVCFFHPFADGNGRAARLALDHVLTRGGLALRVADPAFVLPLRVTNPYLGWQLTYVLGRLAGPRGAEGSAPAYPP